MELRTLKTFVEVVRQGGFSQAAKVVFATQSTVSKAIKQLEDELGLPLLDRLGHKSRMTAAGEIVYRRAIRLLAERDDLQAELEELRGLKRGVLRLGLPPIGSSTLFAPLFALYRQRYPEIEIRLVEHGSDRLSELLAAGDIDFAGLLPPIADEFASQIVRREPLMALISVEHPLAQRDTITLAELRGMPFVLFEAGFALNRIIREACHRRGAQHSDRFHCRACRRGTRHRLPAAHDRDPAHAGADQSRPARRARHRMDAGDGLAARRLSVARGGGMASAGARAWRRGVTRGMAASEAKKPEGRSARTTDLMDEDKTPGTGTLPQPGDSDPSSTG